MGNMNVVNNKCKCECGEPLDTSGLCGCCDETCTICERVGVITIATDMCDNGICHHDVCPSHTHIIDDAVMCTDCYIAHHEPGGTNKCKCDRMATTTCDKCGIVLCNNCAHDTMPPSDDKWCWVCRFAYIDSRIKHITKCTVCTHAIPPCTKCPFGYPNQHGTIDNVIL